MRQGSNVTNTADSARPRWFREPFVHFLILGLLVFVFDAALGGDEAEPVDGLHLSDGPRADDEHVIVVTDELVDDIRRRLRQTFERLPAEHEVAREVERWIETEMLVREAHERNLDRDDPIIRHRLARKMSFVFGAREAAPEPGEAELVAFYEANMERYHYPARVTVRQLFVARSATARERAEVLQARAAEGDPLELLYEDSDTPPGGPVLRRRTPERLAELYGEAFAEQVISAEQGDWHVVETELGAHVISVLEREEGRQLTFEEARNRVLVRWQEQFVDEARERTIDELRDRYEVRGWREAE